MQSTLIRFTDSKYMDSYLKGELYLSSLSTFWDISKNKIPYFQHMNAEDISEFLTKIPLDQQDFSEGVAAQIPRNYIADYFGSIKTHIIHDVRFRLSAYKYCNLLCFFRIDAESYDKYGLLDEDNISYILNAQGENVSAASIKNMGIGEVKQFIKRVSKVNHLLSSNKIHLVQLPSVDMDNFGDIVIVIKDQQEFEHRVISAVKRTGGHVLLGDIRYHPMLDRVDPNTLNQHSITMISSKAVGEADNAMSFTDDGSFHISILDGIKDIYWRGCFDKYDRFAHQKEWRVCWLPNERNYKSKILSVGPLEDIIDIVATKDIREYLLNKFKGYIPGIVPNDRQQITGTNSYNAFKEYVKMIDGLGEFVVEIR
ncbi:hypothetical protein D081_0224 [Anaerovibrio sp. JC8]|uniref:hypothetical protein n=1 Tax=Anaerovibrio sp. JC8 TaxID=1240085 RepID=UPI000A0B92D8|nr:hypothetical protein [Anaerovibrio sp. JC8]ORU01405.1 hypothetical protein D081_0224 [Anaerovibrio sp. JC8]